MPLIPSVGTIVASGSAANVVQYGRSPPPYRLAHTEPYLKCLHLKHGFRGAGQPPLRRLDFVQDQVRLHTLNVPWIAIKVTYKASLNMWKLCRNIGVAAQGGENEGSCSEAW